MTVAPGFIQPSKIISGQPTAAIKISVSQHNSRRLRVLECVILTVQFSRNKSNATGLPTIFERPTIVDDFQIIHRLPF